MAWVAGFFHYLLGLPLTPSLMEVLDGRELSPSDVLGCTHHPLYRLAVGCPVVAAPRGEEASQDALNGAAVEL